MEYTQSRKLRLMLKGYELVQDHDCDSFEEELEPIWYADMARVGDTHAVEAMVGMGNSLVPWELGPLRVIRRHNLDGIRVPFANAHELLARRCVTIQKDFFHALLGISEVKITEPQLDFDPQAAMLPVARDCIEEGDFSVLFMIPGSSQRELRDEDLQEYGYPDLGTFAMGDQRAPPTFSDAKSRSGNPVLKVEVLGEVKFVRRVDWGTDVMNALYLLIGITLDFTGLKIDDFVNTVGARLYGQKPEKLFERLAEGGRRSQL